MCVCGCVCGCVCVCMGLGDDFDIYLRDDGIGVGLICLCFF